MTQKDRILTRLKTGAWLSTVEATKEMFILRLGARVFDLRAEGHNIIERKVAGKSYSEYKLIRPELQKICRLPDGSHLAGACTCSVKPTEPIKLPPAFEPKPEQQRAISLF